MKLRLLFLLCCLICAAIQAQETTPQKLLPGQGEIALEGKISSVEAGKFTLSVSSFILPNGKTNLLQNPKRKTIISSDKTIVQVRDNAGRSVQWNELKPEVSALVIGQDKGSGGDLPARVIQVWQGVKDGVYLWPEAAKAPEPVPVIIDDGPPAEKRGRLPNVLEAGTLDGEENQALWTMGGTVPPRWEKSGQNHYLSLEANTPQMTSRVSTTVPIDPEWKTVRLSAQVKVENLQRGAMWMHTPRFTWRFFNDLGKPMQEGRGLNLWADSDWQRVGQTILVPKDAVRMEINASLQGATGRFAFDNLRLEPNAPIDLLPLREGFPEGTFSQVDASEAPQGFRPWTDGTQLIEENGEKFLRLTNQNPNRFVGASIDLALPREWQAVKVRARVRIKDFAPGPQSWNIAKIGVVAIDELGQRIGPILNEPKLTADADWAVQETTNILPTGTVGLRLEPSLLGAKGTFDVDELQIEKAEDAAGPLPVVAGIAAIPAETFEESDGKGLFQGWTKVPGKTGEVQAVDENGIRYMHLSNAGGDRYVGAAKAFKLPPDWRALTVSARVRTKFLVRTDPNTEWKTARIGIKFQDARGQQVGGWPPSLMLPGNSDWKVLSARMDIPRQASYILIEPMLQETKGEFDVDDLQFEKAEPKVIAAAIHEWTRAFPEGTFERKDERGEVIGWEMDGRGTSIEQEEDNHFLRLTNDSNRNTVMAQSQWRVLPGWKTIRVRARLRAANLKSGTNPLDGARFQVLFSNANEDILMPLPPPIEVKKATDWVDLQTVCPVPIGATVLKLLPTLSRTSGILDIDDVLIEPIDEP